MSALDSVDADGEPRFCGEPYIRVTEPTVVEEARDALAATLRDVLAIFTAWKPGLPPHNDGRGYRRTGWVDLTTLDIWQSVLDEHGGIPRPDVADRGDSVGDALRKASR